MAMLAARRYTLEEYLAREAGSEVRHEFFDGQIYAMAGASKEHDRIAFNLMGLLAAKLRAGPCRGCTSDMRLKVAANGLYTYPDASVTCDGAQFEEGPGDTLLNPKVIFDILSPSTERYDRGRKFALYSGLDSLTDYVLIAQDEVRIEHFARLGQGDWHLTVYAPSKEVVDLPSIDCQLPMSEMYRDVDLTPDVPLRDPV